MTSTAYLGNAEGNAWLSEKLTNRRLWLALHTDEPTAAADAATEVIGGGYERQSVTFGAPSNKTVTSINNQVFSGMPACRVSWVSVWTDRFAGQMVAALQQSSPQDVAEGAQYLGAAGDISLSL